MKNHVLALTLVMGVLAPVGGLAHVTDGAVHRPVNYFTVVPPPAGQDYLDPVFGTAIRRLTNAPTQPNAADGGTLAFVVNEYSTMSPFNQGATRILLQHQSYFALYDGQGRYEMDLPFEIAASTEPRWSRSDPDLLYYIPVYGNSLKRYDVSSGVRSVVRTFSEYSRISGRGESDICFEGDHFVLVGDDHEIFVYELSTDQKGLVLDAGGQGFDSVYITADDQVIVSWYQTGAGPRSGIELYDRDMQFLRQLAQAGGHMDVGRDSDGQGVLFWMNTADPQAPADCQNAVVRIRLADGQRTCLLPLDWSLSVHVSAPDAGPWFFVSTYAPTDPAPGPAWRRYTGELLQVRVDGSEVRRLAHHRSRPFNDYWYTPRAAVSRDGGRLVFSSNQGLHAILGYDAAYADVYLVDLTATAPAYPGSQSAVRGRYEQDHPAVSFDGAWHPNTHPLHSGGSAVLANEAGARAAFAFTGTAVRWVGCREEWSGVAQVYLDGHLVSSVNTYASPPQAQALVFAADSLPAGPHTLEIEASGTAVPPAAGSWIWIDAFEAVVRTEEHGPAVGATGLWESSALELHSGGSALRSMSPAARITFSFMGTAVSWLGYRDDSSGRARVYLDGALRAEIDGYSPSPEARALVYTLSGLPPGAHTLAIEVAGSRHPFSLGDWVWVDAFETLPE